MFSLKHFGKDISWSIALPYLTLDLQNCLILSKRYHWHSSSKPSPLISAGMSQMHGSCAPFLVGDYCSYGLSTYLLQMTVPGCCTCSLYKWYWEIFLRGLKAASKKMSSHKRVQICYHHPQHEVYCVHFLMTAGHCVLHPVHKWKSWH